MTITSAPEAQQRPGQEESAVTLLKLIHKLVTEVHKRPFPQQRVTLDSTLDRDLGLDSLARVELIARIEKHYGIVLPERIYSEAETPRDLLRAIECASEARADVITKEVVQLALDRVGTVPASVDTLVEMLEWHAVTHPERRHIQLLDESAAITYRQLWDGALFVAAGLHRLGVQPGEPVAIMLQAGQNYFFSFFGILIVGAVPVPIYPPARPSQIEDHIRRHKAILENCRAVTLITLPEAIHVARLLMAQVDTLRHIITLDDLMTDPSSFKRPHIGAKDIAFLQYTSGSTGNPKGVVLTHANLLANIRAMGERVEANAEDVFVSWLPLYHDMGLIGAWLGSLYYGALFVVMSPLSFIARPQSWLWAIHRYRGTISASPNFGYELCLRRIEERDIKDLDLSSWRAAFNGAEAVSPETIKRFSERFYQYGFRAESLMPVYGLAESSVGLAFPPINRVPIIDRVERERFMREGRAIPTPDSNSKALRFVSSGQPLMNHQIRIVDVTNRELPDRQEGRLQFRGPSVTSGYFHDPEQTSRLFHEGWVESGDLAYISNGEVYITGRTKDVIIRAGRNLYPHELEEAVSDIDGIRAGRVAVFGSMDPDSGTERLVVLAETRETDEKKREQLHLDINNVVTDLVGAPPDDAVLTPPDTILKTSSGKVRRAASREVYESGRIGKRKRAAWWQMVRLVFAGLVPQLRRVRHSVVATVFGLYMYAVFWVLAPTTWTLVVLLPRNSWRWTVMRINARLLARLTGTPITVQGLENLPPMDQTCIFVANHASYLDGPLMIATLPRKFSFVAKSELNQSFIPRLFLKGINAEFVERFDVKKGIEDFQLLAELVNAGRTLFFFPEGTFTRKPGLLPFHMGAFIAAVEGGVPVVPVTIRGTRSILRSDTWLPNRGAITVVIDKAIGPEAVKARLEADKWQKAIVLRDVIREEILDHCAEPDLVEEK